MMTRPKPDVDVTAGGVTADITPVESRKMNIRLDLAGRRGVCHLTILVRVSYNSIT
jgi:hypothetical protein